MDKIDYSQLYYDKEVKVLNKEFRDGFEIDLDVQLRGIGDNRPDCKVGHFGYNFFYRTAAGIKYKTYTSRKRLELAVEKLLKKEGWTILGWETKGGNK